MEKYVLLYGRRVNIKLELKNKIMITEPGSLIYYNVVVSCTHENNKILIN